MTSFVIRIMLFDNVGNSYKSKTFKIFFRVYYLRVDINGIECLLSWCCMLGPFLYPLGLSVLPFNMVTFWESGSNLDPILITHAITEYYIARLLYSINVSTSHNIKVVLISSFSLISGYKVRKELSN